MRRMKRIETARRQAFMEPLEPRTLLAGDVTAIVNDDGDLRLTGDDAGNTIVVDQAGLLAGQVRITPTGTTTINGQAAAVVLDGVTDDWVIKLEDGDDVMTLQSPVVDDRLCIRGGSGNNTMAIMAPDVGGQIDIVNGNGNDDVYICNPITGSKLLVDNNNGDNITEISGTCPVGMIPPNIPPDGNGNGGNGEPPPPDDVGGYLKILGGNDSDTVILNNGLVVEGDLNIQTSRGGTADFTLDTVSVGDDLFIKTPITTTTVDIDNITVADKTTIRTGQGNDVVTIDDSTHNGEVFIKTGDESDLVTIERNDVTGAPTTIVGELTANLGSGDDRLNVGLANNAANTLVANSNATLNGGPGTDTLDAPLDANTLLGEVDLISFEIIV